MSIFDKVVGVATGGLAQVAFDAIKTFFPPSMSDEQKANVQMQLQVLQAQREKDAAIAANEAEKTLNERIQMYEGTASDLKTIPILGSIMLLLRGAQRPVWGFAALYIDWQVFSGSWQLTDGVISNTFYIVNFLVLGFLFGERAVQNIAPFIVAIMQAKASPK